MNLKEVPHYRNEIMEYILKNQDITKILLSKCDSEMSPRELAYHYVYPYDYIVGKTSDAGVYICFDIRVPRVINRTFNDFQINIWIIAHERCMRTDEGLVTDLLSSKIDELINGSRCFGLGEVELESWDYFTPAEDFHGRALMYRTVDFNRM